MLKLLTALYTLIAVINPWCLCMCPCEDEHHEEIVCDSCHHEHPEPEEAPCRDKHDSPLTVPAPDTYKVAAPLSFQIDLPEFLTLSPGPAQARDSDWPPIDTGPAPPPPEPAVTGVFLI